MSKRKTPPFVLHRRSAKQSPLQMVATTAARKKRRRGMVDDELSASFMTCKEHLKTILTDDSNDDDNDDEIDTLSTSSLSDDDELTTSKQTTTYEAFLCHQCRRFIRSPNPRGLCRSIACRGSWFLSRQKWSHQDAYRSVRGIYLSQSPRNFKHGADPSILCLPRRSEAPRRRFIASAFTGWGTQWSTSTAAATAAAADSPTLPSALDFV